MKQCKMDKNRPEKKLDMGKYIKATKYTQKNSHLTLSNTLVAREVINQFQLR